MATVRFEDATFPPITYFFDESLCSTGLKQVGFAVPAGVPNGIAYLSW